jgi:hypothetical protein
MNADFLFIGLLRMRQLIVDGFTSFFREEKSVSIVFAVAES